jgi:hypothetical protein
MLKHHNSSRTEEIPGRCPPHGTPGPSATVTATSSIARHRRGGEWSCPARWRVYPDQPLTYRPSSASQAVRGVGARRRAPAGQPAHPETPAGDLPAPEVDGRGQYHSSPSMVTKPVSPMMATTGRRPGKATLPTSHPASGRFLPRDRVSREPRPRCTYFVK